MNPTPNPTPPAAPRTSPTLRATRVAAALAVALLAALGVLRHEPGALRGDEGTYVAMAASLARDGDLRFEAADERWARTRTGRPAALILQRTARGVTYSKPVLYPLLAAPLVALVGPAGLLVLNALALAVALALARAALARRPGGERAGDLLAIFVLASPVAPYLIWRMTESLQVALAAGGLALALGGELGPAAAGPGRLARALDRPGAAALGALLLGLSAGLREPNAAVAAVPVLAAFGARRAKRAAVLALWVALGYGANAAVTWGLAGAPNPYKATRATFNAETGYPAPAAPALARFESTDNLATSTLGPLPILAPRQSLYAALYFLVGRHSGLLAYFPAALVLLAAARAGVDRTGWAALAGVAASAGFYLVWWPTNYFGGETVIGNRYLLAALPALLFVPRRLPGARALALGWLLALGFGVSALVSVDRNRELDAGSQSHAYAGLFRLLPYESVASNIEGRRDRYWAGDFLRFVDPYARVEATSFELAAGDPAAELEIATAWSGSPLRFLVVADRPRVTLVASDWRGRWRHELAAAGDAPARGVIEIAPSPAWRIHRFWWPTRVPYRVRLLRLELEAPGGAPARARLRYLGREPVPADGFAREVRAVALPDGGIAGGRGRIGLSVVNRGDWTWRTAGTLPVRLAVRLEPLDGGPASESRVALGRDVAAGERLDLGFDLDWPAAAGRYRLELDLLLEDVARFAERTGEPLARREITLRPAE